MASRAITRRPKIGFHAPIKGGLHESLIIANEIGCDAVQIFSRNPRGNIWTASQPISLAIIRDSCRPHILAQSARLAGQAADQRSNRSLPQNAPANKALTGSDSH